MEFFLQGYDRCYILIDSNVVDFRECAYFTKATHILDEEITLLRIGNGQYSRGRFNCLLEFSLVMDREFVSATINNKGMFLPR